MASAELSSPKGTKLESDQSDADSGVYEEDGDAGLAVVARADPAAIIHDDLNEMEVDDDGLGGAAGLPASGRLSTDPLPPHPNMPMIHAPQISPAELDLPVAERNKLPLEQLMQSDEFQHMINSCSLCKACWYLNHTTAGCVECGGYTLQRPCPVCDGRCQKKWTRDIKATHAFQSAHWDGSCGLPEQEQMALFLQHFVSTDEDTIISGMEDLSAG